MKSKVFPFLIHYFKPNGKYYTSAVVHWELTRVMEDEPYYHDAVSKLRGLRDCGGQGAMPGLNSEGWDGAIYIERARPRGGVCRSDSASPDDYYPDGVPHLLMPSVNGRAAS